MTKLYFSILTALFAAGLSVATASAQSTTQQVAVPRYTIIPVVIFKDIRVGGFGNAEGVNKVRFGVAQDVVIGGFAIAKEGDLVEAHFTSIKNETKRVFSANVSQELTIDVDDVVNFCGDTIHMEFERTVMGAENTFTLEVRGGSGYIAPLNKSGSSGSDVTYFHAPGTYYLDVSTKCSWQVRAYDVP